jgi:hypothetical protein
MKTCSKCQKEKEFSEFNKNSGVKDGHHNYCRPCMNDYNLRRGKTRPDGWIRKTADLTAYQMAYRDANKVRIGGQIKEWDKANPERRRQYQSSRHERRMKEKHGPDYVVGAKGNRKNLITQRFCFPSTLTDDERRIRKLVGKKVYAALKSGKLSRLPCEVCGNLNVEAHHPDYGFPLSVVWLCKAHHRAVHPRKLVPIG